MHGRDETATARSKQLFILRHAKSSWADPDISDFERPLNARGRSAAPVVGAYLKQILDAPLDCVLVSSATRARQTWERLGHVEQLLRPALLLDRLYGADAASIAQVIADTVWPKARRVLVIGHNPGLHDFCCDAAGIQTGHRSEALVRLKHKLPTAGLVEFHMHGSWQGLTQAGAAGSTAGQLTLERFETPRRLEQGGRSVCRSRA
jgi:phosphohistidine phosphatase